MIIYEHEVFIRQVASSGQVSIGKEYAGQQVQISKLVDGTIIIKPGKFIPDNERWVHNNVNMEALDRAIEWAETSNRKDNFDEIQKIVDNE